jgi:hypothetical protein
MNQACNTLERAQGRSGAPGRYKGTGRSIRPARSKPCARGRADKNVRRGCLTAARTGRARLPSHSASTAAHCRAAWRYPRRYLCKRLASRDKPRRASPSPERRAVDMAVDAACALSLVSAMFFPASLIPEGEIIIGVGQHMPFSFLPELEGDAVRLQDFFRRVVAEVSPPLIRRFRASEHSAMLYPSNPRNRCDANTAFTLFRKFG